MNMPLDIDIRIAALLESAGSRAAIRSIEPCAIGGNNRTFRVTTSSGIFAAKQYFSHAEDTRDRLAIEFAFLSFAHKSAPGFVPQPYTVDKTSGIALYEFIDGKRLAAKQIGLAEVQRATDFFVALNRPDARDFAATLPQASEACFSINEHIALIEQKLIRLSEISADDHENRQALALIKSITVRWQALVASTAETALAAGIDTARPLDAAQRCVSPSDFGFHNALRDSAGNIRFLDFEYAGWDDPAKMTGDFFAQVAVPVPQHLFGQFAETCVAPLARAAELFKRAKLLRPLYQIKWCCIVLNVFLPVNLARRRFANPGIDEDALKRTQLAKARAILQSMESCADGLY